MRLTSTLFALAVSLAFVAGAGLTGAASAAPYIMDKSHSQITFTVDHLGFSSVHGQFRSFEAQIDFTPDRVEETRVRFVIDAASVETFWEARDKHLRSKDFFNVDVYPEIIFESTSVSPTGPDTAVVSGNLTMVGQTHPVTFDAKLNNLGPSPFNPSQTIAGFTVTGELDRTDYGMTFAAPAVGTTIPIRIDLEISPGG
ncbi:MAG: YceI family protein [Pseudomonadota bacterium]